MNKFVLCRLNNRNAVILCDMSRRSNLNVYPANTLSKLDFDYLLSKLENLCLGNLGRKYIQQQSFFVDSEGLKIALQQVVDFTQIIEEGIPFPIKGYDELPFLDKISIQGAFLTEQEFVVLIQHLKTVQEILQFFTSKKKEDQFISLVSIAQNIHWDKKLLSNLLQVFDVELEIIKESASPELGKIRKKIRELEGKQLSEFAKVMRKYRDLGFLANQNESVRNGRKVLAVQSEFKRLIVGIYHDDSGGGNIAFIEPQETVLLNNQLVAEQREELREVSRILRKMTDEVRPFLPDLASYLKILSLLDAIRAKAYLAKELEATCPRISDKGEIQLFEFRHPILYLQHKKQKKKIVKNHIVLDKEQKILLISGPNAGGKSVVLKSMGLIQLMFQFGLLIPANEGSQLPIFTQLFVDIGDEQSVENDLSTYSSHLKNLKYFSEKSDSHTLILLDELGHGTDPELGGAMAEAMMDYLLQKHVYAVVTTHYANLKAWGARTPGIVNGAMSFDRQQLSPLYQLSTGSAGSSFTFEIAKKSGIHPQIIEAARAKIGVQNKEMEMSLTEIQHEKQHIKGIRKVLQLREKQVETLQNSYEQLKKNFEREKKSLLKEFKSKSLQEFNAYNRELEKLMREWKENKDDKEKFIQTRQYIDRKRADFEKEEKVAESVSKNNSTSDSTAIDVGSWVRMTEGTEVGKVLELRKNKAIVAFKNITSLVKLDNLIPDNKKVVQVSTAKLDTAQQLAERTAYQTDLDLRGKMKDESLLALDQFLDQSVLQGHHKVRIIHGRGTGTIRKAVHFSLKQQPSVIHFEHEVPELGGDGVTVVELK